jgi:hypothetical protein
MLSLKHPEIMQFLATAGPGLWPMRLRSGELVLAIKGDADLAFAAKHKRVFKFHFYGLEVGNERAVGLMTAFYDQSSAPVVIQTVCADLVMRDVVMEIANMETLGAYFFDVHNSELFGGTWRLSKQHDVSPLFQRCASDLAPENRLEFYVALAQRFSNPNDDGLVIEASLIAANQPDDISIIHLTEEVGVRSSRSEGHGIYQSHLGVTPDPGRFHEAEIARLLARIYPATSVVVNAEIAKGKEFCDVLAIGNLEAVAVQAKSTIQDVRRFDEEATRRDSRTDKHFRKALAQAKGAERAFYELKRNVTFGNESLGLTPRTNLLVHLIVLHDKPPNLLEGWSAELLGFASATTPVVVLDTSEFVNLLNLNKDRDSFVAALLTLADAFVQQKRVGNYTFGKGRVAIG